MEKLLIRPSQIDSQFIIPTDVFLDIIPHLINIYQTQFMFEQFLQQNSQCEGQMEWWYNP